MFTKHHAKIKDIYLNSINYNKGHKINKIKGRTLNEKRKNNGHYVVLSSSAWLAKGLMRCFCKPLTVDIKKPIETHIKNLNEFQPDILAGYFNGLKFLAEKQESKELAIHPKALVNCGEAIVPKDKQYIEHIFKVPLVNMYGATECIYLGVGKN